MNEKRDRFEEGDSMRAQREMCGYRIQMSCANCQFCVRGRSFSGFATGSCPRHHFYVNLNRGICNDFKEIKSR